MSEHAITPGKELLEQVTFHRVKVPDNPHMHKDPKHPWAATHYHVTAEMGNLRPCKAIAFYYSMGSAHENPPTNKDLALALCNMALDGEYRPFEDWADEYGYDKDSRSAENTWTLCLKQARELNKAWPKPLEWWIQARQELDC